MTDAATATPPRVGQAVKLLRVAVCRSASEGESAAALSRFMHLVRRDGIGFDALAAAVAATVPDRRPPASPPVAWFTVCPIGRWAGASLGHIALADLPFLRWLATRARNLDVRAAAAAVLNHVTSGGGHG